MPRNFGRRFTNHHARPKTQLLTLRPGSSKCTPKNNRCAKVAFFRIPSCGIVRLARLFYAYLTQERRLCETWMRAIALKGLADIAKEQLARRETEATRWPPHGSKECLQTTGHRAAATDLHCKTTRFGLRNGLFRPPKQVVSQPETAYFENRLKYRRLRHATRHGGKAARIAKYPYK